MVVVVVMVDDRIVVMTIVERRNLDIPPLDWYCWHCCVMMKMFRGID